VYSRARAARGRAVGPQATLRAVRSTWTDFPPPTATCQAPTPPGPRAGRHRAAHRGDSRGADGRRGVEGHVVEVPLVGLWVVVEVPGGASGVAWEALDQRPRRRVGRVEDGEVRRQPADRDAAPGWRGLACAQAWRTPA
jgi:hypothetical protein